MDNSADQTADTSTTSQDDVSSSSAAAPESTAPAPASDTPAPASDTPAPASDTPATPPPAAPLEPLSPTATPEHPEATANTGPAPTPPPDVESAPETTAVVVKPLEYFVVVDANGVPGAFAVYDPNVPNAAAPPGISIDLATYNALGSGRYALVNGALTPYTPPANFVGPDQIDAERDRRMYGGFVFQGVVYQTDATSIANIGGAAQLAFMAIVGGAKAGDMTWAGSSSFGWIAADNSMNAMDAYTTVAFAKAAAAFRSGLIFAARVAKNALAAGQVVNVTSDATWGMDSTSPTSTAAKPSTTASAASTANPGGSPQGV